MVVNQIAKSLIILISLALLITWSDGQTQQNSDERNGTQDNFHPTQMVDRIKRSKSVGGLTKLSLKKDYDRLAEMARDYHEGVEDISLEQLRERYDVMHNRLIVLLQDKDEEFIEFIHESSDEFWEMLADPEKFQNMTGVSVVGAQPVRPQSDVDPSSDLRTVINLAGYSCNTVIAFSQPIESAYQVSCGADEHYRVHVNEEEDVTVQRGSDSVVPMSHREMSHNELMKKHLLSVVNLAGHDCAALSSYERYESNGHLVTCEDQTVYRVQVTPEGRVNVDKNPIIN